MRSLLSILQKPLAETANRSIKTFIFLLAWVFLAGCSDSSSSDRGAGQNGDASGEERDRYIVVLHPRERTSSSDGKVSAFAQVKAATAKLEERYQLKAAERLFSEALPAAVYQMTEAQAEALRKNSDVAYVEKDQPVQVNLAQSGVTWGLDRIDQNSLPLNQSYNYDLNGTVVNAYVIDTGILNSHQEFEGRAVSGADLVDNDGDATDCNGHGTHVAGSIGSRSFGVAKNVRLIGVRVLDCAGSGSYSGVIAGVEWVTAHHANPAVANMSLGGPLSQALEDAIAASIRSGVTYVVAAGNDNRAACLSSPARLVSTLRVGATTSTDQRSSFSNFGECVDLFAPGSDITSTWSTGSTATKTISGTSMASPHAAGVAALYLAKNPSSNPAQVKAALINGSLLNKVSSPGTGSPNRLLNTLFLGGVTAPPAAPPVSQPPIKDNSKLQNGIATVALSGARLEEKRFTFEIPAGRRNLVIAISGGTGDADLYVKRGSAPSTSSYDCRPYKGNNSESCSVAAPQAGVYSIMIKGFAAYAGVTLKASVE
jgi:serine protease